MEKLYVRFWPVPVGEEKDEILPLAPIGAETPKPTGIESSPVEMAFRVEQQRITVPLAQGRIAIRARGILRELLAST